MDETDIMDLTHQKARKRPRPISSADESVHASLKRLPMRAAECRESSLMYAVRGEPVPAASLKQNDHPVNSSPNSVMPAQVKANISSGHVVKESGIWVPAGAELCAFTRRVEIFWRLCVFIECALVARYFSVFCFIIGILSILELFFSRVKAVQLLPVTEETHSRPRVFPVSAKCLKLLSNFPPQKNRNCLLTVFVG